ncbi:MAG: DnaD domain protein [Lentilactobacillus diolivorans]|jgi:replication initiation and membrane attachment protein|uniref:replication initiation and membrane attachment family protein n=1 Tax=Lentilactobacillus diolivorans TaxID=179838 RepID=UPI000FF2E615|nr:DnaD domain protein [Lentilactobacillus diolivorans]RRG00767.1 MAG: DNA replication protein DnaD [Lactobacillus sp.]
MAQPMQKLTPDTKFLMINTSINTELDHNILTNLYLPIIGEQALVLYELLWSLSLDDNNRLKLHKHYELQSMLNMGTSEISDSRKRLEAVNLLASLVSKKAPESLVYALQKPLSATEFLKTDVLSILLLGKVGDDTYQQIVSRLVIPRPDLGEVTNVSASLLDVFQIPKNLIKNIPGTVNDAKRAVNQNSQSVKMSQLEPNRSSFDFELLLEMLDNSYVDLISVKAARNLILSEHLLYGIDEIEMSKLIQRATNLSTDQLNEKQLKFLIANDFKQASIKPQPVNKPVASESALSADNQRVNQKTQQLIKICQTTAPMVFLEQIKKQKDGIVTEGEQRVLRDLINYRKFSNEVINMMVYTILVTEKQSTLIKALTVTIADNWAQHHVVDAASAIAYLQKRGDDKKKMAGKRYNNSRRVNVKETLPDWAKEQPQKKSSQPAQTKVSQAEKKAIQEKLAKFRKQK